GGTNNTYENTRENSLLEFYLNYKQTFGKSLFDLMGGYSWQHINVESSFMNSDAAGTPNKTSIGSDPKEYFLLALFGRANYSFDDRYLLTFTLRSDGTSRFSPENRWGLFPAAAAAVKVIDNDQSTFNNLKLRIGWGITGQQAIDDNYYPYLAQYQAGDPYVKYQFGEGFVSTLRPNGYDINLKWEETETYNFGAEFSIIRDRLSGTLDLYKRYTTDLINNIPIPAGTNLTNFITTNIGNMESKGLEIAFFAKPVLSEKISWDIGANLAYNQSEITKLTLGDDPDYAGVLTGSIAGGVGSNIQIHSVGYEPYSFYVYEQMYDENGQILENMFVDRNNDGIVNSLDKYRLGSPAADYTLGLTSRLEIGNFDFSLGARASLGNYVYNNLQTDMGYLNRVYGTTNILWNVNQSAVDNNVLNQAPLTFSDHFVKKADFMKVDHITLGYNFYEVVGDLLRIYVTAQNLFVLSSYDGLDPEIFNGIDRNTYPRPRTFVFGLNIEF
ncbi:MAG TPA: TonB-dependent receptor, partial [Saprospiraceae bacterium]|nr:TonB-dependent receptor [Saprospiraceae bacterium]